MIVVEVIAQTNQESGTLTGETESEQAAAEPTETPSLEASETPQVYPIAPGVWYPGQSEPEKPFRYYRVRCWPGCHHASPYGMYPNEPIPGESKTKPQESEPQVTPIPPNETPGDKTTS